MCVITHFLVRFLSFLFFHSIASPFPIWETASELYSFINSHQNKHIHVTRFLRHGMYGAFSLFHHSINALTVGFSSIVALFYFYGHWRIVLPCAIRCLPERSEFDFHPLLDVRFHVLLLSVSVITFSFPITTLFTVSCYMLIVWIYVCIASFNFSHVFSFSFSLSLSIYITFFSIPFPRVTNGVPLHDGDTVFTWRYYFTLRNPLVPRFCSIHTITTNTNNLLLSLSHTPVRYFLFVFWNTIYLYVRTTSVFYIFATICPHLLKQKKTIWQADCTNAVQNPPLLLRTNDQRTPG